MAKRKNTKSSKQPELDLGDENRLKGRYETVYTALNAIIRLYLSHDGMTAKELSDALGGVSPKTAMRHLRQLSVLFPLNERTEEGGKIVFSIDHEIADAARQTDALFSCFELLGVLYVEQIFSTIKGTALANPFQLALRQMKKHLPEAMKRNYERLRKIFFNKAQTPTDYSTRGGSIEILHNAAMTSKAVEIDYYSYSSRRRTKRVVHPYNMTTYDGSIYLIGFDTMSKSKRTFKLDRIREAKILDIPFQRPLDFEIARHLSSSFGIYTGPEETVTAVFDDKVASFIKEKNWHPSQKNKELPDGRMEVTWKVAGTREIKIWLMGFCEHVEVIEPKSLREEIVADLAKMLKAYQTADETAIKRLRLVR